MRCPFCNAVDGEIKKAKLFNYAALGVVVLLVIAIAGIIIFQKAKPLADSVTIEHLITETSETNTFILAKINDEYYETSASADLGNCFSFEDWTITPNRPEGEVCISLRLGELYIVEIYDNGYAAAYDGYAPRKQVSFAYYSIPENVSASIMSHLRQNGIPREMGDGAIGMGTFNH